MVLSVDDKLGPYQILAQIGVGGMGEVYKATDTRLGRVVAVKVSSERFSDRFEHEARAIAALNHPHICQLYDVGPNYLVMEFVDGEPLRGPLPLEKAIEYAGQILDALDAAHRKGLTHRDLKPANILVTKQGVKLLDFGLAKHSAPLSETDVTRALTQQGQIVGTLQYMSPEQLQGKEADARSDLFSFGCVLYEMLSGKQAFAGQTAASVIAAVLERDPAPLRLTPPLDRVIRTCLAKDPANRFQNAIDLKRDLGWALEQPGGVPRPIRRRAVWAAAAAALLIGIGAGSALWRLRQPAPDERVLRLEIDPPPGGRIVLGGGYGDAAISPDGRNVAYTATVGGKTNLWIRPLDRTEPRLIPGSENAGDPFWSPDSKSVGFLVGGQRLRRADITGGAPVPVSSTLFSSRQGATWSEDGQIFLAGMILRQGERRPLFRVPASGGEPVTVLWPDPARGELSIRWPQFLPGGHMLYAIEGTTPEVTGIYAAPLANLQQRVKLLDIAERAIYAPGGAGKGYLLWPRGGALAVQEFDPRALRLSGDAEAIPELFGVEGETHFAASKNGLLLYGSFGQLTQMVWADRQGKTLRPLGDPGYIAMGRQSPDERRIAVQLGLHRPDLWIIDAESGLSSRLTADGATSTQPVWSPDGRVILFVHLGVGELFRKPASGFGDEDLVLRSGPLMLPYDWSRDGRWVLFRRQKPDGKYEIAKVQMRSDGTVAENGTPAPYSRSPFSETGARFSPEPNPRWVAFQSDDSGKYEIYIDSFPEPRGKKRISTAGGIFVRWNSNGRELFYESADHKVMAVDLKLNADSVESSTPKELFPLSMFSPAGATFEPGRDGQRFLVLRPVEQNAQSLTVVVNWPSLLKKGAPAR
jgi:Tol biopolymer transport system component/predicted Ser/Thr protein kinase